MKTSGAFLTMNLVVLAAGILFMAACRQAEFIHSLIFFTGIMLLVFGIANIVMVVRDGRRPIDSRKYRGIYPRVISWACGLGATILGLIMCFFPDAFRDAYTYIFAITLTLGAFYHFFMMLGGLRPVRFKWWLLALPAVILTGACLIAFVRPIHEMQSTVCLLTGIGLILFAATSFVEMLVVGSHNRAAQRSSSSLPSANL